MRGVSSKNSDYLLLYHVDCICNVSSRLLNVPKERFIEKGAVANAKVLI